MKPLPPLPKALPPLPPKPVESLQSEVRRVIAELQADPEAQAAVHELKFAMVTIRRTGGQLIGQLTQALELGFDRDQRIRPWVVNAVGYARQLLRGGEDVDQG